MRGVWINRFAVGMLARAVVKLIRRRKSGNVLWTYGVLGRIVLYITKTWIWLVDAAANLYVLCTILPTTRWRFSPIWSLFLLFIYSIPLCRAALCLRHFVLLKAARPLRHTNTLIGSICCIHAASVRRSGLAALFCKYCSVFC